MGNISFTSSELETLLWAMRNGIPPTASMLVEDAIVMHLYKIAQEDLREAQKHYEDSQKKSTANHIQACRAKNYARTSMECIRLAIKIQTWLFSEDENEPEPIELVD